MAYKKIVDEEQKLAFYVDEQNVDQFMRETGKKSIRRIALADAVIDTKRQSVIKFRYGAEHLLDSFFGISHR